MSPTARRPRSTLGLRNIQRFEALSVLGVVLSMVEQPVGSHRRRSVAPVATTVSAALVAQGATTQYPHMILKYRQTTAQIEDLRHRLEDESSQSATFIDAREQFIFVENQAWLVKRLSTSASLSSRAVRPTFKRRGTGRSAVRRSSSQRSAGTALLGPLPHLACPIEPAA